MGEQGINAVPKKSSPHTNQKPRPIEKDTDERSRRMKSTIKPLTKRTAWKALATHYKDMRNRHLRDLFANDAQRGNRLTAEAVGLYLDYSKNRITEETVRLLTELADECGLRERIDSMFSGEKINSTEN